MLCSATTAAWCSLLCDLAALNKLCCSAAAKNYITASRHGSGSTSKDCAESLAILQQYHGVMQIHKLHELMHASFCELKLSASHQAVTVALLATCGGLVGHCLQDCHKSSRLQRVG
jgi:hypothetical protein